MKIILRNISKDTMKDFKNDHEINLPMTEEDLKTLLGSDEWIIVDSPIGDEFTNIMEINHLLMEKDEETIRILQAAGYLFEEIKIREFTIINFDDETSQWNAGNGVICDDWWKGRLLFELGYAEFPFKYVDIMEDWVRFDALWTQANSEDWREVTINTVSPLLRKTYLVHMY